MEGKPTENFTSRLNAAKRFRDDVRPDIEGALMFCSPGREYDFERRNNTERMPTTQVYSSLAQRLSTDLAGDLVTYYMPPEARWCEYLVTAPIPQDQAKAVTELVQERENTLFDLIMTSNLNDIAPQMMLEAAIHGTPALWVTTSHISQPIYCEVIQPHELWITPGHNGYLDRFRETTVLAQHLKPLFQGYDVNLSDMRLQTKMKKPGATCAVMWGFWLDWEDAGNPQWRCEITVDGKRVTPEKPLTLGPLAGSCPLLVGRFNPLAGRPWPRGPGITATPDLLVHDKLRELVLSGLDQSILSTWVYANDGTLDLSEGIEAGKAYPAGRGFTNQSITDLSRNVNVDQGYLTEDRMMEELSAHFYQDGPRQRGDTPPTATQWIDEARRVQRRLGKPSAPIWSELMYPLVQRFEYLGVQLGKLEDAITHNGQVISVVPISPLQKAQNQDKVMTAQSNLQLAATLLQDQFPTYVDVIATFENIVKTSGDEITVMHKEPQSAPAPPPQ